MKYSTIDKTTALLIKLKQIWAAPIKSRHCYTSAYQTEINALNNFFKIKLERRQHFISIFFWAISVVSQLHNFIEEDIFWDAIP